MRLICFITGFAAAVSRMTLARRSALPERPLDQPFRLEIRNTRPSVGCSTPMRSASSVWFTVSPNTAIQ